MAEIEAPSGLALVPGEKILVTIQSALPDIIVVSFEHGPKSFQGALLDATKRGLPCGVQPPEPINGPDGDKLATIAARFSYFQDKKFPALAAKIDLRRNINPPARYKNARPTVRLRPRQVLCSKCRSICNENSENVDVSKKRKHESQQEQCSVPTRRSDRRCGQQSIAPQKNQRGLLREFRSTNKSSKTSIIQGSTSPSSSIIPKLADFQSRETNEAIQNGGNVRSTFWNNRSEEQPSINAQDSDNVGLDEADNSATMAYCATPRRLSSSSVESAKVPEEDEKKTLAAADSTMKSRNDRVPRKKRSVGSMEDLWDESVFEDPSRSTRSTPVIKISFGTQGGGTVLKIPPKLQNPCEQEMETDSEEVQGEVNKDPLDLPKIDEDEDKCEIQNGEVETVLQEQVDPQNQGKTSSAKAAKRALKKAKKEARRKMLGAVSPARSPCTGSPRYDPNFDQTAYHRRKHKMKHKKKHKEERKHKAPLENEKGTQNWNVLPDGDSYTAIKEQCLKQKLSISLKRLNTNAYARCDYPVSNASSGCRSPGVSSDELSEPEPEVDAGETAPDFPPPTHPLVMRLAATPVPHCLTANGKRMDVGDVVWGKIHGFPWWPGKVLSITIPCKEDGSPSEPKAHVAWYGSSTSSLMSCDQLSPFLETFKTRYNKKKRGPYKDAIRQAQDEARSQTLNSAESVLNVCGSPREVNVVS